ncbi:MAG: molybdate ABC transporter substrate-binding protein [Actinomycetota bacterium]|nr:molybdate ABC transporter substrate-binding protein [Actinomycetota bacterium]
MRLAFVVLASLVPAITAAGCGDDDPAKSDASGDITVFAAASLSEAYEEIATLYERQHDGASVELNFAASSELAVQITEGAEVDVFASADEPNMEKVVDEVEVEGEPSVFATNTLTILTEPGNPKSIEGVTDLAEQELIVVSCGPDVPIGAYTRQVFEDAGVEVEIDSEEADVTAVASKVVLGEADAGIVYATNAVAAGDAASSIAIPADLNVVAEYPIAALDGNGAPFRDLVLGDEGQAILAEYGFTSPTYSS